MHQQTEYPRPSQVINALVCFSSSGRETSPDTLLFPCIAMENIISTVVKVQEHDTKIKVNNKVIKKANHQAKQLQPAISELLG
jgi:hypothetical protein